MESLLVNFGGPRDLKEISPFLETLLTDPDVIAPKYPDFLRRFLFQRIARKRALKIKKDYELIGGKSPIYFDTEEIASLLKNRFRSQVHTFHRYLPQTHASFLDQIESSSAEEIRVLPLFPQFSFATTGSIARFFSKNLSPKTLQKLRWIRSYATHPAFISAFQKKIGDFLRDHALLEEKVVLLFSAHGLPASFIEKGDPYSFECEESFKAIRSAFPKALTRLCYQSKFGRGEWIRPYTNEVCEKILEWHEKREHIVFIPLSFTSDHIETLFEIEFQYLPLIRKQNLHAYRCPALGKEPHWISSLEKILVSEKLFKNSDLFRRKKSLLKRLFLDCL